MGKTRNRGEQLSPFMPIVPVQLLEVPPPPLFFQKCPCLKGKLSKGDIQDTCLEKLDPRGKDISKSATCLQGMKILGKKKKKSMEVETGPTVTPK